MEGSSVDTLQLTFMSVAGSEVKVAVPSTSTVLSIKQAATAQLGHNWPMIRLVVDGREIKNNEMSSDLLRVTAQLLVVPNREEAVQHAKFAQMTDRYDLMVQFCTCFAQMGGAFSEEEAQLFRTSFRVHAQELVAQWQTFRRAEDAERQNGNDLHAGFATETRQNCEAEIKDLSSKFSEVLTNHIIPAVPAESVDVWQQQESELKTTMMTRMGLTSREFMDMLQAPASTAAVMSATAPAPTDVALQPDPETVQQITAMGFTADQAKNALETADGNVETAVALLVDQ